MKPVKFLYPVAPWIMRLGALFFIISVFFKPFKGFDFTELSFYIAAVFIVFGLLLFVGGFFNDSKLTVLSSLVLFLVSIYQVVIFLDGSGYKMAVYIILASIFFYFLSAGNKR